MGMLVMALLLVVGLVREALEAPGVEHRPRYRRLVAVTPQIRMPCNIYADNDPRPASLDARKSFARRHNYLESETITGADAFKC